MVVEIGGGSVACGARTSELTTQKPKADRKKVTKPSVRGGSHDSTEYGVVPIRAHSPKIAE